MKYRHRVLALLTSLSVLTYPDRVCISVAGPRIQNELHLTPQDWGLITGAFAIAYALFEIPSGYLADRFGARAMLSRIVLWWSAFTTLTGFATTQWVLMAIRFLFGAGEAGAYPTASTSVFRWFPPGERGRVFGTILLSGQLGGAIAPLLIVPVQRHYGWRVSFYLFGFLGIFWASGWWHWYRNQPQDKAGITAQELAEIGAHTEAPPRDFPRRALIANRSVWSLMAGAFCYFYAYYFFLFWLPTYMVKRGFTEGQTTLSALPFLLGAAANLSGGFARDAAVRRWGPTWGARSVGMTGLGVACASALLGLYVSNDYVALGCLALSYGGITFQQPTVFATCAEIGQRYTGAVTGCMNTAAAVGGLVSSLIFGYLVQRTGSYDTVILSMAASLLLGTVLWLKTDAAQRLSA